MSGAQKFNPTRLTYGSDNKESREKLRELMLFVADRCQDDPNFGVVKLNKILYYCDFFAFARLGKPITGISYNKLDYGPVPTGAEIARKKMEEEGVAAFVSKGHRPYAKKKMVPLREAKVELFSGPEVALIDSVIEDLADFNATQVKDMSHGRAWNTVGWGETIPYESVFVSDDGPTEGDIARAHELVEAGEWED